MGDSVFGVANENGYVNGNYFTGQSASLMGDDTGSRPRGNATYTGKAIAIYVNEDYEDYDIGDVEYGDFYATYDFGDSTIEMDLDFDNWDGTFDPTTVNSNGSFSRTTNDGGNLKGNFFGNNHNEVAGTYDLPSESVVGSFGGIKEINSTSSVTPEPEPTPDSEPTLNVTLANPGGSRDTSWQNMMRLKTDLTRFLERNIANQNVPKPWHDLEFLNVDRKEYGLIRFNPDSEFWIANPRNKLISDGEYGFNVEGNEKGFGIPLLDSDDYGDHLNDIYEYYPYDDPDTTAVIVYNWTHLLNEALYRGYHQWLKHLDYDATGLNVRIEDLEDAKAAYSITNNDVILDSDWLLGLYVDYANGNNRIAALDELAWVITHEAGHQFGYENPDGDTNGCGRGNPCHGPVGSGSVTSYDAHIGLSSNYGVTPEDIRHIPNASWKDELSRFNVSKIHLIGEYGAWIIHGFKVTGTTTPGEIFGGDFRVTDTIGSSPFVSFDDGVLSETLPSGSATYSGEDNFVGVDMSPHALGALMRADANLIYKFGSTTRGDMSLTVDEFEVHDGLNWIDQRGSITYRLDCREYACGFENDQKEILVWFGLDGQYAGGSVQDIDNEYVGAFVAEKD